MSFCISTTLDQFVYSDICRETKSRAGKSPRDYHLETEDGKIRGKTNCLKLYVPDILLIAKRLQDGENLAKIHQENYQDIISITSMSETMKKYYAGLLNGAIQQYQKLQEDLE